MKQAPILNAIKGADSINLPRIAKKAIASSVVKPADNSNIELKNLHSIATAEAKKKQTPATMRNHHKNVGTTRLKPNNSHYAPIRSLATRTHTISRVNSQVNQRSPHSPVMVGASGLKRDATRRKHLEPLLIAEIPDTEKTLDEADIGQAIT